MKWITQVLRSKKVFAINVNWNSLYLKYTASSWKISWWKTIIVSRDPFIIKLYFNTELIIHYTMHGFVKTRGLNRRTLTMFPFFFIDLKFSIGYYDK